MRILRSLLFLLLTASYITASADELTITALKANANDGIVLTFNQNVKVSHSTFGTKCYTEFTDKDGTPSVLNATPTVKDNIVTLSAAWCTFVNGHNIHLVLNPECFTTLDGKTHLSGTTTFDFIMGAGQATEPITPVQIAPSNGSLSHLGNIAIVFSPSISKILDPAGYSVVNERGHSLPILNVIIDDETSIKALNVNILPDFTDYEAGTTYSLHIAPGALECGTEVNSKEIVCGKWYFPPAPLTLVTNPPTHRMTESVRTVTIAAANGKGLTLSPAVSASDIVVTGIMDDSGTVYATGQTLTADKTSGTFTLTLDREVSTASIRGTAMYNSVSLDIPEGFFTQDEVTSKPYHALWIIERPATMGTVTWNFDPASGSTNQVLGTPMTVEMEEGTFTEQYVIHFSIQGANAYLTINDASNIRIIKEETGATVMNFSKSDVIRQETNNFLLRLEHQITAYGTYTLVIPATSIDLYRDLNHYSEPIHPDNDITATWTVGNNNTTGVVLPTQTSAPAHVFDLQGRRHATPAQSGLYIIDGRKMLRN